MGLCIRMSIWRLLVCLSLLAVGGACPSPDDSCCVTDADCSTYAKCFEGKCALTCKTSDYCPTGQVCLSSGVCAAPQRSNSQCTFESIESLVPVSDAGPSTLADGGPLPSSDSGVSLSDVGRPNDGGGQMDAGSSCQPDVNEPNDQIEDATMAVDFPQQLRICEGGDQDYFVFELAAGDSVEVSIVFDHDEVDLDIKLLRGDQVVAISQTAADEETISFTASSGGTYHLIVYAFMNTAGGPYEIDFDFSVPPGCVDDEYEENDDLSEAEVFQVPFQVDAIACPNDVDFFPFLFGFPETIIYMEPAPNVFFPGFSAAIYDVETNELVEEIFSSETVLTLPNQNAEFFIVVNNVTDTPIPYLLKMELE